MQIKTCLVPLLLLAGSCFLLLTGCEKAFDYIHEHPDEDYKSCNIKKVTFLNQKGKGLVDTVTYLFAYNALGNPLRVTNDHVGTGNPNYTFIYDNYGRLSQFLEPYAGYYNYEHWHKYVYNNRNQVVIDTSYTFGLITSSGPQPSPLVEHIHLQYDTRGRVSFQTDSIFGYGGLEFVQNNTYSYDANGNLITGATYDNKFNLNRTNSVWMFITRNYSVNNPFTATQYNEKGLPLDFSYHYANLLPEYGQEEKVEYWCH